MNYKFLTILFCIFLSSKTSAQESKMVDSLLSLLQRVENDSNKVNLLYELSEQYDLSDLEKAKDYIFKAKQLSQKLNYSAGILRFNKRMMYVHAVLNHNDSAIWYGKQILEIASAQKNNYQIGVALFNLGERYNYKSDYETGLKYMLQGQKKLEESDIPPATKAVINGSIAATYLMMKDYKKSILFGKQAMAIERKLDNSVPLTGTLINLASAYTELKQYNEAEKAYSEIMALVKNNNNKSYEVLALLGRIDLSNRLNNVEDIKMYAERALVVSNQLNDNLNIMNSMQGLSVYNLRSGNLIQAKEWSINGLEISNKFNYVEQKASILETLSFISFAEHDYSNGYKYANEASSIRSGIFTESLAEKQANLREKYETEKKETQIQLQHASIKQKNLLNYILLGSILGLILITLLSYRNYKQKQRIQKTKISELEAEKHLLATQSLLKGQEDERNRMAKDLHDGLGGMLSGVKLQLGAMKGNIILTNENAALFNNALDKLDQSISEMRRVAHNMMPEALLKLGLQQALQDYCEGVNVSTSHSIITEFYGLEKRMSITIEVNIYRIVQELVNNSIKHSEASKILVQVMRRDQALNITVEDNGKGFDSSNWKEKPTAGLQNILSRINYLGGTIDISSFPDKGTSVYVECTIEDHG